MIPYLKESGIRMRIWRPFESDCDAKVTAKKKRAGEYSPALTDDWRLIPDD